MNCTQLVSMSGPSVCCTTFASAVVREMVRSRSAGSSMSVASEVKRLETRLPANRGSAPACSVDTGTPATNERDGCLAVVGHPGPQCAGDDAEHDVVDRDVVPAGVRP